MSAVFGEASAVSSKNTIKIDELLFIRLDYPVLTLKACGHSAIWSDICHLSVTDKAGFFTFLGLILEYSLYITVVTYVLNCEFYSRDDQYLLGCRCVQP